MFNKIIICSFILFLFVIIIEHFIRGGTILEGLDSDAKALMTTPETPALGMEFFLPKNKLPRAKFGPKDQSRRNALTIIAQKI